MRGFTRTAILGVLLSGLLGAGCLQQILEQLSPDIYEPNDTHGTAPDISGSSTIDADFIGDTIDWYMVTAPDDKAFTVSCALVLGPITDITLTLFDDTESWLADGDDGTLIPDTQTIVFPAPGSSGNPIDYYIRVQYTGASPVELYVLTWSVAP